MVLILLFRLFNHDNLILKLQQQKIANLMKRGSLQVVLKLKVYQEWQIKEC